MNVLVSACLIGLKCRYDGKEVRDPNVLDLVNEYNLIPICPEQLGGLSTPRSPAEIKEGKVQNQEGTDVTTEYQKGAEEVLKVAKIFNCKYAILKERSPSCGSGEVYDGSFSGKLISGKGITTKLLIDNGIKVFAESNVWELKKER